MLCASSADPFRTSQHSGSQRAGCLLMICAPVRAISTILQTSRATGPADSQSGLKYSKCLLAIHSYLVCVMLCFFLHRRSPASMTSWKMCCSYSHISVWAEDLLTWPRTRRWPPSSAILVRSHRRHDSITGLHHQHVGSVTIWDVSQIHKPPEELYSTLHLFYSHSRHRDRVCRGTGRVEEAIKRQRGTWKRKRSLICREMEQEIVAWGIIWDGGGEQDGKAITSSTD